MKKTILALLMAIGIINANELPVLKAGQTISSDQLNEIHMLLQKSIPEIKASDLVDSYVCTNYTRSTYGSSTLSPDGLYYYEEFDVTFNDDGDGTFSWTGHSRLISPNEIGAYGTYSYEVAMNKFFTLTSHFNIEQDGANYRFYGDVGTTVNNFKCINTKLLSSSATDLTATATNDSVTLTWMDNSTDETGFKILRKDSLTGAYSVIDTVGQDVTTYTDNTLVNGTYWYRVQVSNINGDSLASNVTKVVVAN